MRYIHHIENFPTKEEMSQADEDRENIENIEGSKRLENF